jgi:hypothetical protein
MKGNFCGINNFKPGQKTREALAEVDRITRSANILTHLLSAVPLFQFFAGRSSYLGSSVFSSSYNISTYDWDQLASALSSIDKIKRKQLISLAWNMKEQTSSDESKFWKCVYNAL